MVSAVTQDRLETLQAGFEKAKIDIVMRGTPAFNRYKVMKKSMPTKVIWARKILTRLRDQINMSGNISTTATAWTVDGSTATNPLKYWPGYMAGLIGTEWVSIDAQPSATTLTVTRAYMGSTAATHADNDYLYLIPLNAIGSAKLGKDDSQFSGREHNLIQNYQDELPIANLLADGRMPSWIDENEASFESQKKDLDGRARLIIERAFFYSRRNNLGGAAASTAGVTLTADGGKNTTGGLHYFNGQHSGRSATYTTFSLENIQTGVTYLAENGAFSGLTTSEYDDAEAVMFVSPTSFNKINQLRWPAEIYNDGKGTTYGSTTKKVVVSGYSVSIERSDGVQNGHWFLVPNRKDTYQIMIQRFGEKQPENYDGDQTTCIYTYTWMNKIGDGYATEFASGLPTS